MEWLVLIRKFKIQIIYQSKNTARRAGESFNFLTYSSISSISSYSNLVNLIEGKTPRLSYEPQKLIIVNLFSFLTKYSRKYSQNFSPALAHEKQFEIVCYKNWDTQPLGTHGPFALNNIIEQLIAFDYKLVKYKVEWRTKEK